MLALAALDAAAAVVFALIYLAAAARMLAQPAFLAALGVFFAGATALWVHLERAPGRAGDPLRRLGRIAGALVLTSVALPVLVLTPLFGLRQGLPPEADLDDILRRALVVLLVSLVLVAFVNGSGLVVLMATGLARRLIGTGERPR